MPTTKTKTKGKGAAVKKKQQKKKLVVKPERRHTIKPSPARPRLRRGQHVKLVLATPKNNYTARLITRINNQGATVIGTVNGGAQIRLQSGESVYDVDKSVVVPTK